MARFPTLIFCSFLPALAQAAVMAPTAGALKFQATASPGALAIRGGGEAPSGKLEVLEAGDSLEISGTLKLAIESLKTGISLRDAHMKNRYLEAGKFPEALLIIPKQKLPKNGKGTFAAELVLHGVRHKVSGTSELQRMSSSTSVHARFPVRLTDHGIEIPSFAGITVADEVAVETDFQLAGGG